MEAGVLERAARGALDAERQFVLTLGGYAIEVAGAVLVLHERIPSPRFNFVEDRGVGRQRTTAFLERALDHYFQRALRPTFRIREPAPPHLDAGLRRLGFRPRSEPLALMVYSHRLPAPTKTSIVVRPAAEEELDTLVSFWTGEKDRPEFRTALDIAWAHPNPGERLVPLLAFEGETPVSAAIVYRFRDSAGIHAVATRASARGRGAASELVRHAVRDGVAGPAADYSIFSDSERLERRLTLLGFLPARRFLLYELPPDAVLALPDPGPPQPPRWRPPRDATGPPRLP